MFTLITSKRKHVQFAFHQIILLLFVLFLRRKGKNNTP